MTSKYRDSLEKVFLNNPEWLLKGELITKFPKELREKIIDRPKERPAKNPSSTINPALKEMIAEGILEYSSLKDLMQRGELSQNEYTRHLSNQGITGKNKLYRFFRTYIPFLKLASQYYQNDWLSFLKTEYVKICITDGFLLNLIIKNFKGTDFLSEKMADYLLSIQNVEEAFYKGRDYLLAVFQEKTGEKFSMKSLKKSLFSFRKKCISIKDKKTEGGYTFSARFSENVSEKEAKIFKAFFSSYEIPQLIWTTSYIEMQRITLTPSLFGLYKELLFLTPTGFYALLSKSIKDSKPLTKLLPTVINLERIYFPDEFFSTSQSKGPAFEIVKSRHVTLISYLFQALKADLYLFPRFYDESKIKHVENLENLINSKTK